MINLRQLKAFVTVAEKRSFTHAAKIMYMTQPAISAQIKALEDRLDIRLIERSDKNVILTEAGELLYDEARQILALYDGFLESIDELKGFRRGKLQILASTIPGEYVLPKLLGEFGKLYPGIQLSLKIEDTGKVVDQLLKRKVDIGFIGAMVHNESLHTEEFVNDELIVIGAPTRDGSTQEITLDELLNLNMVLREPESGTRMEFYERLRGLGVDSGKIKVAMELGSTRAIITAVEQGIGISVVSRFAAEDALSLGKISEIKIKDASFKRTLYLVWNVNKYKNYATRAFLKFLEPRYEHAAGGIS